MIGFHIQNSPRDWPAAVARLPAKTPVKMVLGVERCREAKAANPTVRTWYRWVGGQPLPSSNFEAHARTWLNQFVDGTFRREAAWVDWIGEYNETLANSQDAAEKARWLALHTAMAKVWAEEYRREPELAHIRMTLCATAVGNDIPLAFARAAAHYGAILDYHPYIVCRDGEISPNDWRWYSGRWAFMDDEFRRNGVLVDWAFGEMGAVRDAAENWGGALDPQGGWKHPGCLNGDIERYKEVLWYWLDKATVTPAWRDGRVLGGVLFTSGAPGTGPDWKWFDILQPDMSTIAEFVRLYDAAPPPPPPPPDPEPEPVTQPRTAYRRRMHVLPQTATLEELLAVARQAYATRSTIGFSYDDAGYGAPSPGATIGPLESCTAVLYGIPAASRQVFVDWYAAHYPGTAVEFATTAPDNGAYEIVDIVEQLPVHETLRYADRPLEAITTLTIHHTVSPPERPIAQIAQYHVSSNGWPGIGYHFVIDDKGVIYQTNHLTTKSYHAGSASAPGDENYWSVGIALQGDFTNAPPPQAQQDAARWLVARLRGMLATATAVAGHRQMPGAQTACPGATWESWLPYVAGG